MSKESAIEIRRKNAYTKRNQILRFLGFPTYKDYLASELWAGIRGRFLERNPTCKLCGGRANQVHHKVYTLRVLNGESEDGLHALCGGCHHRIEFKKNGFKLSPYDATKKLRKLRKAKAYENPPKPTFVVTQEYIKANESGQGEAIHANS